MSSTTTTGSGIGMSSCCLSGKLADTTKTPSGKEEEIGGLQVYVARPENDSVTKSVIFLADIFGWRLPNVRLLADNYAKSGFTAYIPDIHDGDFLPIDFLDTAEPPLPKREARSLTDSAAATASIGAMLGPWLIKHREAVARPVIEGFINHVRGVPGTDKVGAIGFCWGGRYAILAAQKPFSGAEGRGVDAAYACHPSLVAIPGDFDPVVVPLSLAVGDKDSLLSNEQVEEIRSALQKKEKGEQGEKISASEIEVYQDQIHGFALRGDWSAAKDKKAMDEAEKQGIKWFEKYLA
ncbi:uncharacterized protein CLAFUR5_20294 [Fulvia fulva]|uniref:uncharacterized protein n=1 Tax=Passalora fulva TaxID=5499 RepID=UPI0028526647|nr:uncharacterized protein CLAFUR5_20294 [Fulvia fulva]KAK4616884.1 hypothetical protein CLAFUR0_10364 [Fulvia fulva]WMI38878.1 hypothetical protein CLAFUR5_20294 [Fulvia fulva]